MNTIDDATAAYVSNATGPETALGSTGSEAALVQTDAGVAEPLLSASENGRNGSALSWEEAIARMEKNLGIKMSPYIKAARIAFRRDLPDLLKDRYRQWVAYNGDRQLGFGHSKTKLYQDCLRQGLKPDEFLVLSIEPENDWRIDVLQG
jgi:hypothetical protein